MKTSAVPLHLRLFTLGILMSMMCAAPLASHAAVSAGGLVVVGYTDDNFDNGSGSSDDVISLLATETINAGEVIYLTNSGWINSSGTLAFSGADPLNHTAAGFEQLTKLTINSTIFAGTVVSTNGSSSAYSWTTSGQIPGQVAPYHNDPFGSADQFSALDLAHDTGGGTFYADQIYIFQANGFVRSGGGTLAAGINPLLNPTNFIHALNIGSDDAPVFDDSYSGSTTWTGSLPDGRVSEFINGNPYHTGQGLDLADNDSDLTNDYSAFELDSASHFFDGTSQINFAAQDIIDLNASGGTKEQWLVALASSSNWIKVGSSGDPNFSTGFNFIGAAPEPSRALLVFIGSMSIMFRRRRCC